MVIFSVNYLFFVVMAFFFAIGQVKLFIVAYSVALFHEVGHIIAARCMKMNVSKVKIQPFGVTAEIEFSKDTLKNLAVIYAGPFINIIFLFIAVYLKFNLYNYFVEINVYMLVINLLPVYPLDGGRAVFEYLLYYIDTEKLMVIRTVSSMFVSVFITVLGCVYFLHTGLNFSLLIIGLFLLSQTVRFGEENEISRYNFERKCKTSCANYKIKIYDVARKINFNDAHIIHIVDDRGNIMGTITGKKIYSALLNGEYDTRLYELLDCEEKNE